MLATHRVSCTTTAGELSALLLESREVKRLAPLFNRRLRKERQLLTWQLSDERPFLELSQASWPPHPCRANFGLYRNKTGARKHLELLVNQHGLCKKMLGLEQGAGACFGYQLKRCSGVCMGKEPVAMFVERMQQALAAEATKPWPFSGPVGIVESDSAPAINVVDQWYYLGVAETLEEARDLSVAEKDSCLLDRDSYRILVSFILRPPQGTRIIPI